MVPAFRDSAIPAFRVAPRIARTLFRAIGAIIWKPGCCNLEFPGNLCTEGTGWSGPKCTDHVLSACGFEGVQFLRAMASWISKTWIEQALMASKEDLLPKITKAQILKVNCTYLVKVNLVERRYRAYSEKL